MTEQGKAQIQMVGAGLVGFAIVVGVGSALLLMPHGATSTSTASAASTRTESPLAVPVSTARTTAGAPMGEAAAGASSPAPILPDAAREENAAAPSSPVASAPAAPAGAAGAPAPSIRKLVTSQHLDSGSSAGSSASASATTLTAKTDKPMKKPFLAPKLDMSRTQSAVASSVHYGVTGRSELMGRAAGPVYNFSGKSVGGGQSDKVAAGSMMGQVDAAQAQLDAAPLNDHDKAVLEGQLSKAKQAVTATAAAPAN